jgi:hypothetical protein
MRQHTLYLCTEHADTGKIPGPEWQQQDEQVQLLYALLLEATVGMQGTFLTLVPDES